MGYLVLSSTNRTSGPDSNFTINQTQQIPEFTKLRLSKGTFTNSLYNVHADVGTIQGGSNNNTFTFQVQDTGGTNNTGDLTVTITPGNYTVSTLTSALTTAMNAAIVTAGRSETVTWTSSAVTSKLTLAISANVISVTADNGAGLNLPLGFSRTTSTSFSSSIVAPRVYNLAVYGVLYIYCNLVAPQCFTSNLSQKTILLDIIPVSSTFGQLQEISTRNNWWLELSNFASGDIIITVTDDQGKIVNFNGGYITLEIECV